MKKYLVGITIAFLVSCATNSKEETTSNSTSKANSEVKTHKENSKELTKKKEENEKLEKLRFYLNNSSVTDESGIKYNLTVKPETVAKNALYTAKKIHYEYRYDNFDIVVKSYEITTLFKLFSNGELRDKIELKGFLLESKRSDKNDLYTFCSDSFTLYPKLESKDRIKSKVSKFTGVNCGLGTEINNRVRNERVKAVKACNL